MWLNHVRLSGLRAFIWPPSRTVFVLEQIFERHQFVALAAVRVHIVIDCDVADAEHGEALLNIQPCVELVPAQTGQVSLC